MYRQLLKPPGLRIVKTGIAILISLYISLLFRPELSFYAVIAVVFSMDKNLLLSLHAGKSRMVGTLLGALIGVFFAEFLPGGPWSCAIGTILLIWLLNGLKLNSSIIIASIVFLAITSGLTQDDPAAYSTIRLFETLIGIVVAWLVNILILPYNNLPKIHDTLELIRIQYMGSLGAVASGRLDNGLDDLEKSIRSLNDELELYLHQFSWHRKRFSQRSAKRLQERLKEAASELAVLARLRREPGLEQFYARHLEYATIQSRRLEKLYRRINGRMSQEDVS